jgi:hypothetical protein
MHYNSLETSVNNNDAGGSTMGVGAQDDVNVDGFGRKRKLTIQERPYNSLIVMPPDTRCLKG